MNDTKTDRPKTLRECDEIYESAARHLPPGMYFLTVAEPDEPALSSPEATLDDWGLYHLYSAGDVKLHEYITLFDLMPVAQKIWIDLFSHTRHWFVANGLLFENAPQWRTYADKNG